jgi:hypothetical protein
MSTLSAPQQSELEKPVTRYIYFVELHLLSTIAYFSSLMQTVTWGGHDWIGMGSVAAISPIDNKQGVAAQSITFQLNMASAGLFAVGVGSVEEYRGRDAKIYFCPLDEQFRLVGTPVICWRGTMDVLTSAITGKAGESSAMLSLKCETSAYGLKRRPSLRMNAAQQKQRHSADTGFDFLTKLIADPGVWISVKFQRQ